MPLATLVCARATNFIFKSTGILSNNNCKTSILQWKRVALQDSLYLYNNKCIQCYNLAKN